MGRLLYFYAMSFLNILILFTTGILGGTVAGMFGIGGGIIYVLVYSIFIEKALAGQIASEVMVQLIILNAVSSILIAAIIGSYRQYKFNNFYPKKVFLTGIPGAIMAFLVTALISIWAGYNQRFFLIFFTFALIPLLLKFIPNKIDQLNENVKNHKFSFAGTLAGAGTALSGLGGGFILNPLLYGAFKYPLKRTFSVSLGSMLFTTTAVILYHLIFNNISSHQIPIVHFRGILYAMILPVIAGVIIGTPLGVSIAHKLNSRQLSFLFFIMALLIIIRNCFLIFMP